ncbi:MAG TPA: AtpZ/AtpI family protein [Lacipirellulaceae bacterium]|nr:AtpZ/AtpI family protein [Lacipirellulaceae bacterium]
MAAMQSLATNQTFTWHRKVTTPSDDLSPVAKAYVWAYRIIVVALEMVLPGLAGYWLDKQLGTVVLFMLVGFTVGCTAAIMYLIQITRADNDPKAHE